MVFVEKLDLTAENATILNVTANRRRYRGRGTQLYTDCIGPANYYFTACDCFFTFLQEIKIL